MPTEHNFRKSYRNRQVLLPNEEGLATPVAMKRPPRSEQQLRQDLAIQKALAMSLRKKE